jgi:Surface antigen variable number repeat
MKVSCTDWQRSNSLGNHAVGAATLRGVFPIKEGAIFSRSKVASGLDALRKTYLKRGFRDFTAIPDTEFSSNATVTLKINVTEGPQYHMGKLEVLAEKDLADRLRLAWKLDEGKVYNSTYIDKYIEENRDLLPSGFGPDRVDLAQDCPKALVDVRMKVADAGASNEQMKSEPMKNIPCEKKEAAAK